jgi:hypothetical protein
MACILGLMTMATRLATSACSGSNRAAAQVAQGSDLICNVGPLLFEGLQGLWNRHRVGLLFLAYCIRTEKATRKESSQFATLKSRTLLSQGKTPHFAELAQWVMRD